MIILILKGYEYDKEIYANTRKFILSEDNPNYRSGKFKGVGSDHMRSRIGNNIWPMAQIMQGIFA
jgi:meiotically up-regulated gene 157 (Mug157) protein